MFPNPTQSAGRYLWCYRTKYIREPHWLNNNPGKKKAKELTIKFVFKLDPNPGHWAASQMRHPKIAKRWKQVVTKKKKSKIKKLLTKLKSSPSWITQVPIKRIFEQGTEAAAHNCSKLVRLRLRLKGPAQFHPSLALHLPTTFMLASDTTILCVLLDSSYPQ